MLWANRKLRTSPGSVTLSKLKKKYMVPGQRQLVPRQKNSMRVSVNEDGVNSEVPQMHLLISAGNPRIRLMLRSVP